jgi:hypothetical protein
MDGDGVCCGVLRVGTEEGKRGRGAAASSSSFLRGAGEAGGRWGSGNVADVWRKQGTSRGSLPTGERCPTGKGSKPTGARDMRRARTAGRTEGEGRG